mmetsp:Transcript_3653/g.9160  ORF Transcript_3653/g.9160 Transcript_3653/m.9160 type:complete len:204 (-) Transcript_3653:367-978(-)
MRISPSACCTYILLHSPGGAAAASLPAPCCLYPGPSSPARATAALMTHSLCAGCGQCGSSSRCISARARGGSAAPDNCSRPLSTPCPAPAPCCWKGLGCCAEPACALSGPPSASASPASCSLMESAAEGHTSAARPSLAAGSCTSVSGRYMRKTAGGGADEKEEEAAPAAAAGAPAWKARDGSEPAAACRLPAPGLGGDSGAR